MRYNRTYVLLWVVPLCNYIFVSYLYRIIGSLAEEWKWIEKRR